MIKLIKQADNEIDYWEVWEDNNTLIIHYGTVGDTGETEGKILSILQNATEVMEKLSLYKLKEEFHYLEDDHLIELIVQYSYEAGEMEEALQLRHSVEDLMNECLGWTGNGSCDGGDIGSGTANILNYVIDPEKAALTIIEELKNNGIIEGVKIAYLHPEDEEYILLYPPGVEFDLM